MKKTLFSVCLVAGMMVGMAGCGSSDAIADAVEENVSEEVNVETATGALPAEVQVALDAPVSKLSQELTDTLAFMGNEERLAYDVYNALYEQYGTKQFTNIATNGEYQHIGAVQQLIQKYKLDDTISFTNVVDPLGYMNTPIIEMEAGLYDVPEIQKLYDDLMARATTEIEALKVGCIIEVVDVNDLTHDIALAQSENATDVVTVFSFLRDGSYNHYWAFDKGLKNKGVSEGCCTLGVDYCHPEYPQK